MTPDAKSSAETLRREWGMPHRYTFNSSPIDKLVRRELTAGLWIDPFAGKSEYADVTNDIDPDMDTDHNLPAVEFLQMFDDNSVDGGVIFDPPYSATQLKRKYNEIGEEVGRDDTNPGFAGRNKDEIERICQPGTTVLSFGWNSVGMGKNRRFSKREILMVCHGSSRNDTICVVEDYVSPGATSLTEFKSNA